MTWIFTFDLCTLTFVLYFLTGLFRRVVYDASVGDTENWREVFFSAPRRLVVRATLGRGGSETENDAKQREKGGFSVGL